MEAGWYQPSAISRRLGKGAGKDVDGEWWMVNRWRLTADG